MIQNRQIDDESVQELEIFDADDGPIEKKSYLLNHLEKIQVTVFINKWRRAIYYKKAKRQTMRILFIDVQSRNSLKLKI